MPLRQPARRRSGAIVCLAALVAAVAPLAVADPPAAGATERIEVSYDPALGLDQEQVLTVTAIAGSFSLTIGADSTAPLAATADAATVEAAIEALPGADVDGSGAAEVTVTGGSGGAFGGFHYRIRFDEVSPSGVYPRLTATNLSLSGYLAPSVVVQCVRCGDLQLPAGTPPPAGWPVVVLAHSGGFSAGAKDPTGDPVSGPRMQRWAAELNARGYATFAVNYHLADPHAIVPLYNQDCDLDLAPGAGGCDQVLIDTIAAQRSDFQLAVQYLRTGTRTPRPIDTTRLAMLGESAGATGALEVLYAGTTGATAMGGGDAGLSDPSIAAAVSIAGFVDDARQGPGEGSALVMSHTNDIMGELFGFDMFDESREVLARAQAVGNDGTSLVGYCTQLDADGNGTVEPQHLPPLDSATFADMVERAAAFLDAELRGLPRPLPPSRWGHSPSTPFTPGAPQVLVGDHRPVTGDFDGDGREDVYLYGPGASCDTMWFGEPDRTLSDPDELLGSTIAQVPDHAGDVDVVVGDLNGDGRDDLVFGDGGTGTTDLWYGTAARNVERATTTLVPSGARLTVADVDGDGFDDLVADAPSSATATVLHGTATTGVLTVGSTVAKPVDTAQPFAGDVDGDGRDDLLWYDPIDGVQLTLWHALAGGSFEVVPLIDLIGGLQVAMPDVNGDGTADPTLASGALGLAITFAGIPGGGFVAAGAGLIGATDALDTGDVDGDGTDDLLWSGPDGTTVWFGAPVGQPLYELPSVDPAIAVGQVVQLDADGDGRVDRLQPLAD